MCLIMLRTCCDKSLDEPLDEPIVNEWMCASLCCVPTVNKTVNYIVTQKVHTSRYCAIPALCQVHNSEESTFAMMCESSGCPVMEHLARLVLEYLALLVSGIDVCVCVCLSACVCVCV